MDSLATDYERMKSSGGGVRPDDMIQQFEASLPRGGRRAQHGAYYTPQEIVSHVTDAAFARLTARRITRPTVLDPACGAGMFLLAAFRRLSRGVNSVARRCEILSRCIFGVDADAAAVETARRVLSLAVLDNATPQAANRWLARHANRSTLSAALESNVRWGDALFDTKPTPTRAPPIAWREAYPDIFAAGGFELVLANPPFLSYSGREGVKLPPAAKRQLAKRFGTPGGWLTSHGCFVQIIATSLSRGVAGIVLPEQVAHLTGYAPARAAVTRATGIVEIRSWGEKAFADVLTPVVTVLLDREHHGAGTVVDDRGDPIGVTRTRALLAADGGPWRSAMPEALRLKLEQGAFSLGKLVADPGVHTGNAAKELIATSPRELGKWTPVLQGRNIDRYRCHPSTAFLRTDLAPTKLRYFRIAPRVRYADAAFVIRQTAACPIVAPRRHADYFRNSLLALYPPSDGVDVRYLVGVLNSRLMRLVHRVLVGESRQRTFPQVKVSSLRLLPIKRIIDAGDKERAAHDRIVALVSRMLEAPDDETDRAIDREVELLYGLSKNEWSTLARLAGEAINH